MIACLDFFLFLALVFGISRKSCFVCFEEEGGMGRGRAREFINKPRTTHKEGGGRFRRSSRGRGIRTSGVLALQQRRGSGFVGL